MNFKKPFLLFLLILNISACTAEVKFDKAEIFFIPAEKDKKIKIVAELAVTKEQQLRGFMERKIIPEGTGMLFLYACDGKLSFWMKNTPVPLSIAFIGSNGVIKEIRNMEPYSLDPVISAQSVRYALETPRGMFDRLGLKPGDALTEESLLLLKRTVKNTG